jgi:hypothetical protein
MQIRILQIFSVLVFVTLIFGCGPSITVNHDYDPGYNFSTLKTFAWIPVKTSARVSELTVKRFQNAIEKQLEAKGMTPAAENPDFLIALQGTAQNKVNVTDYGYSYGRYWGGGMGGVDINTYQEGTIYLDFIDGKSKELFWRGTGTSVVEPGLSAEAQENKFNYAAEKILQGFPPAAK